MSNQNVEYGHIATFECQDIGCHTHLKLQVNGRTVIPRQFLDLSTILSDSTEYNTSSYPHNETNRTVVNFWFVVNNESIQNISSIQCKCGHFCTPKVYLRDIVYQYDPITVGENNFSVSTQYMDKPTNIYPNVTGAARQNEHLLSNFILLTTFFQLIFV